MKNLKLTLSFLILTFFAPALFAYVLDINVDNQTNKDLIVSYNGYLYSESGIKAVQAHPQVILAKTQGLIKVFTVDISPVFGAISVTSGLGSGLIWVNTQFGSNALSFQSVQRLNGSFSNTQFSNSADTSVDLTISD